MRLTLRRQAPAAHSHTQSSLKMLCGQTSIEPDGHVGKLAASYSPPALGFEAISTAQVVDHRAVMVGEIGWEHKLCQARSTL